MSTWRLELSDPRGTSHDVFVTADPQSSTTDLQDELQRLGFQARPFAVHGRTLTSRPTLLEAELENGDTITCGRIEPSPAHPGAGWYVVSVTGPDAGRWHPLVPGTALQVGRATRHGFSLDDSLLSAAHCRLTLTGDAVEVVDSGSTNGTFVEGAEIGDAVKVERGQFIQVGSTTLAVVEVDDLAVLGDPDGPDRVFPRQYRRALPELPNRLEAPKARESDEPAGGAGWWRSAIPLVTGAGFALVTGRWIFLLIMAMAPIIFTVDAVRRRKRTLARETTKQARYQAELADFTSRVVELRRVERQRRRDNAMIGGLSTLAASARLGRLWERSPSDPDFLHLGVGIAPMPSAIVTTGPDVGLPATEWGAPVATDLRVTGSLAVVGDATRNAAVARSLLLALSVQHSPTDVRITVLTRDQDAARWGWARWLPHTFHGDHGCTIGSDADGRASLLNDVTQLLETRRELRANTTSSGEQLPLPIHIVLIDDTSLVPAGQLAEILSDGPPNGIVGITLDSRLAPEGAGATLTLSNASDTCVFESRHQPRVEGLAVAEMSVAAADGAARRLAGLRPTTSEASEVDGLVHLIDIVDGASTSADVLRRWQRVSPRTEVVVGTSAATPMCVDLVRDGPHGLIGGTSGSGKTEFLKTLFCSLALNNHPDDLSIVIVDFKGGVDHEAVKPLPHVVDVATNLDIEQFKRTILLLKSESRRRQDLLSRAGASNIDAYRMARAARNELPTLPRLLVVVDEFSELLASDGGREQLKELESITRMGRALGLHLLLVTQNFDGNLPPQIDANAGLRICLRVQKPAHSKAVLDSGVAATIADSNVGRAYARFHGRNLIEFQTARVAGRRRDLATTASAVTARLVPFAHLAMPAVAERPEDVPFEETDLYVVLHAIREAATASGWSKSAVPWPSTLPERISLQSLSRRAEAGDVPVGIADVPAEQRRVVVAITDRDQQVALLGGPSAPLADVLAMYATSLAVTHGPDDVHIYAIDLVGRGLSALTDLPHCGGVAVRNEALALRILRWLARVAAERKVAIAGSGTSTAWEHAGVTGELPTQIVLLVSGADRLLSTNDGPVSNLLGPLTSLMSEAIGTRIQVVLAGLPKIVGHRLGMNIDRRFVFQLSDPQEYSGLGVPRAAARELRVERRAIEVGTGRVVQFAQLAGPGAAEGAVIRQVSAGLSAPLTNVPRRFADVSWPLPWAHAPHQRRSVPAHLVAGVPVGISTDDGDWSWIDIEDDGPVFAVAGPPKSGRSTALAAIAKLGIDHGYPVLNVCLSRRSPLATSADPALSNRVAPADVGTVLAGTPGPVILLFDDLQRLSDASCLEAALEHRDRVLMVVSGSPDLLGSRTGILRSLPQATAGLLLAPSGSLDGGAIGLRRLPNEWVSNPRPGRGILAIAGEATEVQIPDVGLGTVSAAAG